MDFLSQSCFCNAKSVISTLFSMILWASRLPFPMQVAKQFPTPPHFQLGLKTIIFPEAAKNPQNANPHHPQIIHKYKVSSPSSRSSSLTSSMLLDSSLSWSSSAMDDLIGTDSGVPVMLNEEQEKLGLVKYTEETSTLSMSGNNQAKQRSTTQRSERIKREYPPPIPLLAQTGSLQGRMPWVLTKHYNHSDGRLVLKGERVKYHEYFEAHRENGHLILNLVPLDNAITCCDNALTCCGEENDEELETEEDLQFVDEEDGEQNKMKECCRESDVEDDDECDNVDLDETHNVEKKAIDVILLGYNSGPQSHFEMRKCEKYGSLPSLTNAGENNMLELDSTSFCDAQTIHEHPQTYLGHPASAPLHPMTRVM